MDDNKHECIMTASKRDICPHKEISGKLCSACTIPEDRMNDELTKEEKFKEYMNLPSDIGG